MDIYLTLDYELFFGEQSGTPEHCIIKPTQDLLSILDPLDIKATFYVDAGYLIKLKAFEQEYPHLKADYNSVANQIKKLAAEGHAIGLHIHPHWEDSIYDNDKWKFDTSRYKLKDFSNQDIERIVNDYTKILEDISQTKLNSYRAGGWSAQPFEAIGKALAKQRIFIDSTVFPGGIYKSNHQWYDFTTAPKNKSEWQFSTNPAIEDATGKFKEIPISALKTSPLFYWKFALTKIFKKPKHKSYGNGSAISLSSNQLTKLLTRYSESVVSMDGYKASLLKKALKQNEKKKINKLVVIGHPKAFTPYSLDTLKVFVEDASLQHKYKTL